MPKTKTISRPPARKPAVSRQKRKPMPELGLTGAALPGWKELSSLEAKEKARLARERAAREKEIEAERKARLQAREKAAREKAKAQERRIKEQARAKAEKEKAKAKAKKAKVQARQKEAAAKEKEKEKRALEAAREKARTRKPKTRAVQAAHAMPTASFIVFVLVVATLVTAYVGHVHATKALHADIEVASRQNHLLEQRIRTIKNEYDALSSPDRISRGAIRIGLVEAYDYGPTIKLRGGAQ